MAIAQNYPNIVPSLSLDFANVKALDPRITFNRASTATYYGTETAKAEENLLLFSQEFDNAAWGKDAATVTANATTAPDGTTTADLIVPNTDNSVHSVFRNFANGTYTLSVFAKANGYDFIRLRLRNTSGVNDNFAFFNLSTGSVASTDSTASITSFGNGWFRCSIFDVTNSEGAAVAINIASANGVVEFAGDGTSGIFLWGAQLEQRDFITAYTPTTTQPITNYIPVLESEASGVARFDHNPVTKESLGLLIEEQRTNLLLRSEEFDNASWAKTGSTVVANTIVAPNGTLTGDKLVETTATSEHRLQQTVASGVYTLSCYAKAAERTFFSLALAAVGRAYFDLTNGVIGNVDAGVTASIQSVGNGWYRCVFVATSAASTAAFINAASANGTVNYTGDGFSGIFIWGAQLEAGAFATSYIPTSASQVTRAADAASMTGANFSGFFNPAEGTICQDFVALGVGGGDRYSAAISETGSLAANSHNIRNFNGTHVLQTRVNSVTEGQVALSPSLVAGVPNKVAYGYKVNDFAGAKNGGSVVVDTTGVLPSNLVRLDLPGSGCNHIKKLAYYPVRVTNAALQALTS